MVTSLTLPNLKAVRHHCVKVEKKGENSQKNMEKKFNFPASVVNSALRASFKPLSAPTNDLSTKNATTIAKIT